MTLRCAVVALKGGVGKTTTTLGLAGAAWATGRRTLVIDLDPQSNATAALDPLDPAASLRDVLRGRRSAADAIVASGWGMGLDLLAADSELANDPLDDPTRLRASLGGLSGYDRVFFDCPPSLGGLTRNALAAADVAVIVTEPSYFGLTAVAHALKAIATVRDSTNLALAPVGIVVNRVRPHTSEHALRLAELREAYGDHVLDPPIEERTCIQQAQGAGVPIQAWRTPAASAISEAYEDLLGEITRRSKHRKEWR